MKRILKIVWQLPQYVVARVLLKIWSRKILPVTDLYSHSDIIVHHIYGLRGGVSLGPHVFVQKNASKNLIKHELGHSKQSLMLGPLYLIIIGLPSVLWLQCYKVLFRRLGFSYYWFYTERWAEKLK